MFIQAWYGFKKKLGRIYDHMEIPIKCVCKNLYNQASDT